MGEPGAAGSAGAQGPVGRPGTLCLRSEKYDHISYDDHNGTTILPLPPVTSKIVVFAHRSTNGASPQNPLNFDNVILN